MATSTSWGLNMCSSLAHNGSGRIPLLLSLLGALSFFGAKEGTAQGQERGVSLHLASSKITETSPNKIITVSFLIENTTDKEESFVDALALPPNWRRVFPASDPFILGPRGQSVRVLALFVPANESAGPRELNYGVQSQRHPSTLNSASFIVAVQRTEKLDLALTSYPEKVVAGESYDIALTATNNGNQTRAVNLISQSSENAKTSVTPGEFTLSPGEARTISVHVETDKNLRRKLGNAVTVSAKDSNALKEGPISRTALTDLIPLVSGDTDIYNRFPMRLRQTFIAENGGGRRHPAQFQVELSGDGPLDEAGDKHVDFILRAPGLKESSLFGEQEEYGATYRDQNWQLGLGDRLYQLSPLTERNAFGRGAGLAWHSDNRATALGGFYLTTRYRADNQTEVGAFASQKIFDEATLQANFLRKTGKDLQSLKSLPQDIFSLEGRYAFHKILQLQLEYGISQSDSGLTDSGYHAEARGEIGKLQYAIEEAGAGKNFHGYDNATSTTNASLNLPLLPRLQGHSSFNRYASNFDLNPERSSVVTKENSYTGGATYTASKETDLSLDYQQIGRADILLPAEFDFKENSLRTTVSHNFGQLALRSYFDAGTIDNFVSQRSYDFVREAIFLNWSPTSSQTYSVFAIHGPSSYTGSPAKELNFGVSSQWQFKKNTNLQVNYSHNEYDDLTGRQIDQASLHARYILANKTEIGLIGRIARSSVNWRNEEAFMLSISVPFGVPVSRKKSIGQLEGRVVDAEKKTGLGHNIVRVGDDYTVTDAQGNFNFTSLKPGEHPIQVEGNPNEPGRINTASTSVKIRIAGAQKSTINLPVTRPGALIVKLPLYKAEAAAYSQNGALGMGVAELGNGTETLRQQADRLGNITFDNIRPGKWTLRVFDNNLPRFYYVETPESSVEIASGTTSERTIRILEKPRRIKLIDVGAVNRTM